MKRTVRIAIALLAALTTLLSLAACSGKTEPKTEPGATAAPSGAIETEAAETKASETEAPETDAAETDAPETNAAETNAAETEEPAAQEPDEGDGQNPVMNVIGVYTADRCTITISAKGKSDAAVKVTWGASADTSAEYTMSGTFDVDTMRINYSDCEKKFVRYNADGSVAEETVEFTGGVGRLQFLEDGSLLWQDENEAESLAGMVFTFGN